MELLTAPLRVQPQPRLQLQRLDVVVLVNRVLKTMVNSPLHAVVETVVLESVRHLDVNYITQQVYEKITIYLCTTGDSLLYVASGGGD